MSLKKRVSRRTFHRAGTAAWGTVALGCGRDQRSRANDTDEATGGSSAATGGASGGSELGGAPPFASGGLGGGPLTCGELTATNIEGPFFLPNSPERMDIRSGELGPPLVLTGTVYDATCAPIHGALLDFWQADGDGSYDTDGTALRGHQSTLEDGSYRLSTIVPGRYLNGSQYRPAHIHVKVTAFQRTLTTQLYFPNDPYNEVDPFIDFGLIVDVTSGEGDVMLARFDFYVPTDV